MTDANAAGRRDAREAALQIMREAAWWFVASYPATADNVADAIAAELTQPPSRARCDHVIATLTRERDEARAARDATIRWARDMSERCDAFTRRAGGNVVKPNAYDELLAALTPTLPSRS